jgi:hypothetical protein
MPQNPMPLHPPRLLRDGHPCNPTFINDVPHIKINIQGEYDRLARLRPAIPDPNHLGCYRLAPDALQQHAGNRRKTNKRKTRRTRHSRHTRHSRRR